MLTKSLVMAKPFGFTKKFCTLHDPHSKIIIIIIKIIASPIIVTMTRQVYTNLPNGILYFSVVKFAMCYEKNMSFLS